MMKDRHGKDLTEAEKIKKIWKEYTEDLQKSLNDLGNHNGAVTHVESDILDCAVKWTLGRPTVMNKGSGGNGILAELLKILKGKMVKE